MYVCFLSILFYTTAAMLAPAVEVEDARTVKEDEATNSDATIAEVEAGQPEQRRPPQWCHGMNQDQQSICAIC